MRFRPETAPFFLPDRPLDDTAPKSASDVTVEATISRRLIPAPTSTSPLEWPAFNFFL
jgi:hypothetical protein